MFLNCHTYYSLRYGTFSEDELLAFAKATKNTPVVLTDINNTSACLNFIRKAPKYGIIPRVGIDFRNGADQCYIGIAQNNQGFLELNNHLSQHLHQKENFDNKAPVFKHVFVIYPFKTVERINKSTFRSYEYIGIAIDDLNKLPFSSLKKHRQKLVALHTISFRDSRDYNIHRLLRAIDNNLLLSKLPLDEQGSKHHIMIDPQVVLNAFANHPYILKNTSQLLEQCRIHFDFSKNRKPQNLRTYTGAIDQDFKLLKKLCKKGLDYRYNELSKQIQERLQKELTLIKKMDFVSFFLVNWRIVQYAKSKGYYYVGRGSGANSIVAYLLQITDVDPIELDLYFERFMNLYRANPPDFDIDFSTRDREDITRFIFDTFGKQNQVALLGAYVTFKHNGAVRELGKVFGLPKHEIDKLSDGKYNLQQLDKLSALVIKYAGYLQGMPNYLSIHAGGILIAEQPIHYFSATHLPPKGFPTVQFDMHIAEDVGLYKYDILGQRGLGKIKEAIAIIKENHPDVILPDIHNVKPFFEDQSINQMVSHAQCIGCFYVESPAMRSLLTKLSVDNYLGLVAASSIIRPGISKSGMMREYILRHKNPERRAKAHPVLWNIMPDTYGVMVYQEDVIKVAHLYAGLDLGEADVLRRGMSGKFRSREEFQAVKQKFVDNCRQRGETDTVIFDVWRQVESFAGYAFAKGHSASYAVESYQSLYLKCYYPLEYMVATINNGGGFYRVENYIHEAQLHGATIHPPCVNTSEWYTNIKGTHIYLGFGLLNSLDHKTGHYILDARAKAPFSNLEDFIGRIPIGIEQLEILIRIDAFRFTQKDKRTLLWRAHYLSQGSSTLDNQTQLFRVTHKQYALPQFTITQLENVFDQIELLGFPLCNPFLLLEKQLQTYPLVREMNHYLNKKTIMYGYLVHIKNTKTSGGKRMHFGTFLDHSGQWLDTVHFPPVAKRYPFRGKGIYKLYGKIVEEFGFITMEVISMNRLPYIQDPRFATAKINNITPL